jgi:hypothetical protein
MRRKQAFETDAQCAWIDEDGTRCDRLGEELDHVVPSIAAVRNTRLTTCSFSAASTTG